MKAFEIPKDFSRKVLCVRVWGGQPQHLTHTKSTAMPCFLFFHNMLELRSKPCFKGLFEKSPLKIRKNFMPTMPIYLDKAFEVPRNFSRKVSCVRVPRRKPQHSMHSKKARRCRAFLLSFENIFGLRFLAYNFFGYNDL